MIKPVSVNHTALRICDAEKTRDFYEGVLGLKRLPRPNFPQGGHWFGAGENQIHVIVSKEGDIAGPGQPDPIGPHIAIEVEDFEATMQTLKERGIPFALPKDFGMKNVAGNQLWILDPDGNTIELRNDS
jgi:catechol 2,3-dioxygenase-like lactoylglutathione lyase family enzyme